MKTYLILSVILILTACNSPLLDSNSIKQTKVLGNTNSNPVVNAGNTGAAVVTQTIQASSLKIKNYNQYNMSLAKLTGLNQSKYNDLFEALKSSLPADNDVNGVTAFNLVAMTRLADAYCKDFIERESTTGLKSDLSPLVLGNVRDFLMDKFLDLSEGEEIFASLKVELDNILKNDDGTGTQLFPSHTNDLTGNKALASAACVAVLASPYITLLH